jgi:hypothetical protein
MAHVNSQLTRNIEIGAVRVDGQDGLEVVVQDNLQEVRNSRVDSEPREWQISLPPVSTSGDLTDYNAIRQMWHDTLRGLHTFDFYDYVDAKMCRVRFASPLQITMDAGHLRHVDTITLREAD